MLGFDAPLTIETKDVLGRPKGGRAACQRDRDRHCPSSRSRSTISYMLFIAFHFRTFYLEIPLVAFRINWAISVGWDTCEVWLAGSAIVVAFICFANIRSRAGGITWSS